MKQYPKELLKKEIKKIAVKTFNEMWDKIPCPSDKKLDDLLIKKGYIKVTPLIKAAPKLLKACELAEDALSTLAACEDVIEILREAIAESKEYVK